MQRAVELTHDDLANVILQSVREENHAEIAVGGEIEAAGAHESLTMFQTSIEGTRETIDM